jgi:hypothetical protein
LGLAGYEMSESGFARFEDFHDKKMSESGFARFEDYQDFFLILLIF